MNFSCFLLFLFFLYQHHHHLKFPSFFLNSLLLSSLITSFQSLLRTLRSLHSSVLTVVHDKNLASHTNFFLPSIRNKTPYHIKQREGLNHTQEFDDLSICYLGVQISNKFFAIVNSSFDFIDLLYFLLHLT